MICGRNLNIGYRGKRVVSDFSLDVKEGEIISIIGPNGSGKSTILRSICRFIDKESGLVYLEKENMDEMDIKDLARKMSSLSQHNTSPGDIKVRDLIYYGRLPHKKWYEFRNEEDDRIVDWAIEKTCLQGFEDKRVMSLSGGERQRVWIAMAIAQKPKVLLLDEPTTYLDICNQLEILELIRELNRDLNLTVIMVLHDLGQAAKYSDRVLVIKDGRLQAEGCPRQILTEELIKKVYRVDVRIDRTSLDGDLIIHPLGVCKDCEKECRYDRERVGNF